MSYLSQYDMCMHYQQIGTLHLYHNMMIENVVGTEYGEFKNTTQIVFLHYT